MTTVLPDLKEVGREIRQRRRRLSDERSGKPVTQRQLAQAAGIRQSMMAKVESGMARPSYEVLKKVLEELAHMEHRGEKSAGQLMHRGLIGISASDTLAKAGDMMTKRDVSQLVVYDNAGKIVGSISDGAVLRAISEGAKGKTVADAVEAPFPMIDEKSPKSFFASLLIGSNAVIVTRRGEAVGIITRADVI